MLTTAFVIYFLCDPNAQRWKHNCMCHKDMLFHIDPHCKILINTSFYNFPLFSFQLMRTLSLPFSI